MRPSEESMKIAGIFEKYTRDGNKAPIEAIPEEKLQLAYLQYARDKGTPHYMAMEMKLNELKESKRSEPEKIKKEYLCGPLGNPICNQREFIDREYSDRKIFLDIPYTNYEEREVILREVTEVAGLNAVIAKDLLTSNVILCKVCKIIQSCKYGISDASFDRHSVTYELGLMHGFGKKVCILLQEDSVKFSDVEGLEHTSYSGEFELKIKLAKWIIHNVPESNRKALEVYVDKQNKEMQKNGERRFPQSDFKRKSLPDTETSDKSILQFRDERIEKISWGEMPVPFEGNARIILHLIPSESFKDEKIYNIEEITANPIKLPLIPSMGWNSKYNFDGFVTFSGKAREKSHAYTHLYKNGVIEAVDGAIMGVQAQQGQRFIPSDAFESRLIISLDAYLKVMKAIKVKLPIKLFLTLINVKSYTLSLHPSIQNPFYSPSSIDRDPLLLPQVIIDSYDAEPKRVLKPCFDALWNACGSKGSPYYDKDGN